MTVTGEGPQRRTKGLGAGPASFSGLQISPPEAPALGRARKVPDMTRDLSRLLRPTSIAVIGGGAWCAHVVANCRKIGFAGADLAGAPERTEIAGEPAYRDIADPARRARCRLCRGQPGCDHRHRRATCAVRGAGGAVVYASGFREALAEASDGADLQADLLRAAGDMPLIGPNCYGLLNYLDGAALWPDQHGGVRVDARRRDHHPKLQHRDQPDHAAPRPAAGLCCDGRQSGADRAGRDRHRRCSTTRASPPWVCISKASAICARSRRWRNRARDLGKPIVALKVGRSEQARAAAISHTASLAGSDAGARALFARLGIARGGSLSALLETLKLLHVTGPLASNRIASMSCSGGEASLMADAADGRALTFPPLTDSQTHALRQALGPMVALANPLDYHTYIWGRTDEMTATFSAMMDPSLALGAVVLDFPRADRCSDADWEPVIEAVAATKAATGRPMALIASLPETMPEDKAARLIDLGIAPLAGLDDALDAIAAAAWLGQDRPATSPVTLPQAPEDTRSADRGAGKGRSGPVRHRHPGAQGGARATQTWTRPGAKCRFHWS